MKSTKIPTRNVWFEDLPKHGFVTQENNMFIWNGPKRGTGRERAVICWSSQNAVMAQRKLKEISN